MTDKRPGFTAPDELLKHRRWILVANRAGARVLEGSTQKTLSVIQRFDHPEGRLKNQEIVSDSPGNSMDGSHRHSMTTEHSPKEHVAEKFAKVLATFVAGGRTENRFAELVLVADPKFLGTIQSTLDKVTAKSVVKTIDKDFAHTSDSDLIEQLQSLI